MKKKIYLIIMIISMAGMFSCTKTENCECSYTDSEGTIVSGESVELKGSKKKIKEACDNKSKEWSDVNGSCEVK